MSENAITIGFKASGELVAKADAAAKAEGLSRSDIARRALLRDLGGVFAAPPPKTQEKAA